MIIKTSNKNKIYLSIWRTFLYELLLNKHILLKVLKSFDIKEDSHISIYKKSKNSHKFYGVCFDILIKIKNNNKTNIVFIVIGKSKNNTKKNILHILPYRSMDTLSIEELIYASTSKKAKIVFSFFKSCDKRKIIDLNISKENIKKQSCFTINNMKLPPKEFLQILLNKLSSNKNRIIKTIIGKLLAENIVDKQNICEELNINKKQLQASIKRLFKKFSSLQSHICIDKEQIKLK